jgi:hypothetical protein
METLQNPDPEPGKVVPAGGESHLPVDTNAPAALVAPGYSAPWRALFGFIAIAMAFAVVVLVLSGGWVDLFLAAGAAGLAGIMGYFAVTGREPASSLAYTPSRRFAELADPARPAHRGRSRPHLPAAIPCPAGRATAVPLVEKAGRARNHVRS